MVGAPIVRRLECRGQPVDDAGLEASGAVAAINERLFLPPSRRAVQLAGASYMHVRLVGPS
jgi:hypothetical protein